MAQTLAVGYSTGASRKTLRHRITGESAHYANSKHDLKQPALHQVVMQGPPRAHGSVRERQGGVVLHS